MKRSWISLAILLIGLTGRASSEDQSLITRVMDGKSGTPVTNERLLVFGGSDAAQLRAHQKHFEIFTDDKGDASLKLPHSENVAVIQVWADFMTLCQDKPNLQQFAVADVLQHGLVAPNTCSKTKGTAEQGVFKVYVRHSSLVDEMKR